MILLECVVKNVLWRWLRLKLLHRLLVNNRRLRSKVVIWQSLLMIFDMLLEWIWMRVCSCWTRNYTCNLTLPWSMRLSYTCPCWEIMLMERPTTAKLLLYYTSFESRAFLEEVLLLMEHYWITLYLIGRWNNHTVAEMMSIQLLWISQMSSTAFKVSLARIIHAIKLIQRLLLNLLLLHMLLYRPWRHVSITDMILQSDVVMNTMLQSIDVTVRSAIGGGLSIISSSASWLNRWSHWCVLAVLATRYMLLYHPIWRVLSVQSRYVIIMIVAVEEGLDTVSPQ